MTLLDLNAEIAWENTQSRSQTCLFKWRASAERKGRVTLSASRVNLNFSFARHQQTVEFDVNMKPSQIPEFFCLFPTATLFRGDIKAWIWELVAGVGTRLWVPTELAWRAILVGGGIARVVPLDGKITGSAGIEKYRRADCWWISFCP